MHAEHIVLLPVESSSLSAIGYNVEKEILAVRFTSGAIFHYGGVSLNAYTALLEAQSLGSYFAKHVKSKYRAEKMTGDCPKCGDRHGWIGETCGDCGCADYAPEPKKPAVSA